MSSSPSSTTATLAATTSLNAHQSEIENTQPSPQPQPIRRPNNFVSYHRVCSNKITFGVTLIAKYLPIVIKLVALPLSIANFVLVARQQMNFFVILPSHYTAPNNVTYSRLCVAGQEIGGCLCNMFHRNSGNSSVCESKHTCNRQNMLVTTVLMPNLKDVQRQCITKHECQEGKFSRSDDGWCKCNLGYYNVFDVEKIKEENLYFDSNYCTKILSCKSDAEYFDQEAGFCRCVKGTTLFEQNCQTLPQICRLLNRYSSESLLPLPAQIDESTEIRGFCGDCTDKYEEKKLQGSVMRVCRWKKDAPLLTKNQIWTIVGCFIALILAILVVGIRYYKKKKHSVMKLEKMQSTEATNETLRNIMHQNGLLGVTHNALSQQMSFLRNMGTKE